MRIDLFLKAGRLIKRRTVAQEMCTDGSVLVNSRAAKPGKEVKPGDRIAIRYASRVIELEVLAIPAGPSRRKPADELYRVISETPVRDHDPGV